MKICLDKARLCYLLDYVTRQSEKLAFKKKKGFCLTPLQNCSFLAWSEIIEKIIISKHYSAAANYIKITMNGVQVLFSFLFFFFFFFFFLQLPIWGPIFNPNPSIWQASCVLWLILEKKEVAEKMLLNI